LAQNPGWKEIEAKPLIAKLAEYEPQRRRERLTAKGYEPVKGQLEKIRTAIGTEALGS
jgi:hypothetical protein